MNLVPPKLLLKTKKKVYNIKSYQILISYLEYIYFMVFFIVEILLKATGNAPILKTKKWMVEKEKTVASIHEFLRKLLKLDPSDSLVNILNI